MMGWAAALLAAVLAGGQAAAQSVVPPAAGPTRPLAAFEEPAADASPVPLIPAPREQVAPPGADEMMFTFQGLRIEGVTVLDADELIALWPHSAGDVISVEEIFAYANAVTGAYARAGYALSFALVPQQQIADGIVTVRVVEGFIAAIEFAGGESVAEQGEAGAALRDRVQAIAANILHSHPLRTADLERYVLLINDLPGVEAAVTLAPAPQATGGSTLRIAINAHRRIEGQVEYNNYLSDLLDRHVAGGWVQANGALTGAERIRLGGWRSVTSDAYWSASGDVSAMIGADGWRVGLSGLHSQSDPDSDLLSSLEYLGTTTFASVYASYPLVRSRAKNVTVGASLSMSNSRSDILSTSLTLDRLRTFEAFASYDFVDENAAANTVRFALAQGLDVFDATGNSRASGELTTTTMTLDASTDRPLATTSWGTLAARLSARGQAALGPNALFSAAECSYGGRRFGRGFEPSLMSGDHCIMGAAELRLSKSLGLADADLYGFIDAGLVRQKGVLEAGERRERAAASAGAGLRLRLAGGVAAMVEAGWPLAKPAGSTDSIDDLRMNVSMRVRF